MIKYELADCNVISEIKNFGATSLPGPEGRLRVLVFILILRAHYLLNYVQNNNMMKSVIHSFLNNLSRL